jgi:hypothetical protein
LGHGNPLFGISPIDRSEHHRLIARHHELGCGIGVFRPICAGDDARLGQSCTIFLSRFECIEASRLGECGYRGAIIDPSLLEEWKALLNKVKK